MSVLAPLLIGVIFGALLSEAGLTRYDRVVGVYRLTDFTMLKFLGAAIVVGAAAIQAARSLGLVTVLPVTPTHLAANGLGGAILGMGMASAGFCPGTIVAGAGGGSLDYLVPGGLGLVAGALVYGWTAPHFMPALGSAGALGATTLPRELGVSGWLVVVLLAELALIGFYALERVRPARAPRRRPFRPAPSAPPAADPSR